LKGNNEEDIPSNKKSRLDLENKNKLENRFVNQIWR